MAGSKDPQARSLERGLVMKLKMSVAPEQEVRDEQIRQVARLPHSPVFGQKHRQGGPARKPAHAVSEGRVHSMPGFTRSVDNLPRITSRVTEEKK
jgi:hypothetical protein